MAILTGDPLHEQVEMLQIGLAMNADADAQFSTVVASYFRGEHRLLWEFSQDRMLRHPEAPENLPGLLQEIEYELLTRRNLAWAELLARETASGRYMVAAGAAHLSGEDGVLNLLARAGYRLTRLD